MYIRDYKDNDLTAIVDIFTASVHGLATPQYTAEQCHVWAPMQPDLGEWRLRLANLHTLVAENHNGILGFLSYDMNGHIDLLYTSPTDARHGVASMLYEYAEAILIRSDVLNLVTESSLVARTFFESKGFTIDQVQLVQRKGIGFKRFVMQKTLHKH